MSRADVMPWAEECDCSVCRAKAQDDWTKDLPLPSFMKGHGKRAIDQTAVDDNGSIAPS